MMMSRVDFWDLSQALGGSKWKFPALRCHLLEVLSWVTSQPGCFAGGLRFHCHSAGWHCWCQAVGIIRPASEILTTDPLQGEEDLLKHGIILPCSGRPLEAVEGTRLGVVSEGYYQDRALPRRRNTALNYLFWAWIISWLEDSCLLPRLEWLNVLIAHSFALKPWLLCPNPGNIF